MTDPLPGFSLHITITIKPEDVTVFIPLLTTVVEKNAALPEFVFFELYQSPEDAGVLSWVENWTESIEWVMKASRSNGL